MNDHKYTVESKEKEARQEEQGNAAVSMNAGKDGAMSAVKMMFKSPGEFFKKYVDKDRPLLFPLFIIMFFLLYALNGASGMIHINIEMIMQRYFDLYAKLGYGFLPEAITYFISAMVSGLVPFIFLPLFYAFRMFLAGAKADIKKAFKILVYSSILPALVVIIANMLQLLPFSVLWYNRANLNEYWFYAYCIKNIAFYGAMLFSVYVSYRGVNAISNVNKTGSAIIFQVFPAFWYIISFIISVVGPIYILSKAWS